MPRRIPREVDLEIILERLFGTSIRQTAKYNRVSRPKVRSAQEDLCWLCPELVYIFDIADELQIRNLTPAKGFKWIEKLIMTEELEARQKRAEIGLRKALAREREAEARVTRLNKEFSAISGALRLLDDIEEGSLDLGIMLPKLPAFLRSLKPSISKEGSDPDTTERILSALERYRFLDLAVREIEAEKAGAEHDKELIQAEISRKKIFLVNLNAELQKAIDAKEKADTLLRWNTKRLVNQEWDDKMIENIFLLSRI